MAIKQLEDVFNHGIDILGTSIDGQGTITGQTGDAVAEEVSSNDAEMWQHVGFASRPAEAIAGKSACQAVTLTRGTNDIIIATRDIRGSQIYGNLQPGETCIYAGGHDGNSQGKVMIKDDGSVTLYTTVGNTHQGSGVMLQVAPDRLSFIAPWGKLIFDASGFHVQTQTGATIDLTNLNVPALSTVGGLVNSCRIVASTITADAPMISLGPGPTSGGLGYMGAAFGLIPPVSPFAPILGVGVGAVTVNAAASTKVFISP